MHRWNGASEQDVQRRAEIHWNGAPAAFRVGGSTGRSSGGRRERNELLRQRLCGIPEVCVDAGGGSPMVMSCWNGDLHMR